MPEASPGPRPESGPDRTAARGCRPAGGSCPAPHAGRSGPRGPGGRTAAGHRTRARTGCRRSATGGWPRPSPFRLPVARVDDLGFVLHDPLTISLDEALAVADDAQLLQAGDDLSGGLGEGLANPLTSSVPGPGQPGHRPGSVAVAEGQLL